MARLHASHTLPSTRDEVRAKRTAEAEVKAEFQLTLPKPMPCLTEHDEAPQNQGV